MEPISTLSDAERADIEKNRDVAAAAYLWIMSVVIAYARRDSPFIQYHAKQGMWLFALSIPIWFIPVVGHLLEFFILAGAIMGFLNALQGQRRDVPVIGALARGTITLGDLGVVLLLGLRRAGGTLRRAVTPVRSGSAPSSSPREQRPPAPPPAPPAVPAASPPRTPLWPGEIPERR